MDLVHNYKLIEEFKIFFFSSYKVKKDTKHDAKYMLMKETIFDVVVKNPPANAGDTRDTSLILGSGRSPKVGNGNLLHYFCLENSMDRGAWWARVHGIKKSPTQLSN